MSKVDWSLAPNWATHALVKLHNPGIGGVHWSYFIDGEHRISPDGLWFHPDGYRVAEERPRNVKPKPWSGPEDGLPPINTLCEMHIDSDGIWVLGRVIAHAQLDDGIVAVAHNESEVFHGIAIDFRPIKTPAQIAAEQRETAIAEMAKVLPGAKHECWTCNPDGSVKPYENTYEILGLLVDAGFKREGV